MTERNTICLNMIVKNESSVIERCLRSVHAHIDYWVIVDTGSTDDTIAVIEQYLKGIPGELISRPWVNFSHNRNEALQNAKGKGDYILIIDADEELEFDESFEWPELVNDSYDIKTLYNELVYSRTQLLANRLAWEWRGVLHEYVTCGEASTGAVLAGVRNIPHPDGARSQDRNKFLNDAKLLKKTLKKEPHNERYLFYLAQSYRDAGHPIKALLTYKKRVQRGGWDQEVWYSLYQIGLLQLGLGVTWDTVLHAFLEAYEYRPQRSEPLFQIVRHYRVQEEYESAYEYSQKAMKISYPSDSLFIDNAIYKYLLPMEHAICCYWVGEHQEAIKINNMILAHANPPKDIYTQVTKNLQFSLDLLPKSRAEI